TVPEVLQQATLSGVELCGANEALEAVASPRVLRLVEEGGGGMKLKASTCWALGGMVVVLGMLWLCQPMSATYTAPVATPMPQYSVLPPDTTMAALPGTTGTPGMPGATTEPKQPRTVGGVLIGVTDKGNRLFLDDGKQILVLTSEALPGRRDHLPLTEQTKVLLNDKESNLGELRKGMWVGVELAAEGDGVVTLVALTIKEST